MVQLKVYQSTDKDNTTAVFLDLYETSPIKLTLSIEDITNAEASSVFSKTFRVPATRDNNEFFNNAFEINGIDFDVTTKKPADIQVDGAEFKQGHVRLQKIFLNGDQDRIDYELLFLGETRDFASAIGDARMCDLNMDDLAPPNGQITFLQGDIEQSWLAYDGPNPGGIEPTLTDGLANGNLLFPLIDHGNNYIDGDIQEGKMALGTNAGSEKNFNHSANAIATTRFKPMIRAKRIIDEIFDVAGYKYESEFFDSKLFHQIYVSAFGNTSEIGLDVEQSNNLNFRATEAGNTNGVDQPLILNDVVQNPGGNYNTYSPTAMGSSFTVPVGVNGGDLNIYYVFNMSAYYDGAIENSDYTSTTIPGYLTVNRRRTGVADQVVAASTSFAGSQKSLTFDTRLSTPSWNVTDSLQAGDELFLEVITNVGQGLDFEVLNTLLWECVAAPGNYYTSRDLDCDYAQIDFVKDILTTFRLVLAPKTGQPNTFIIEPWDDYVAKGRVYDWSKKLVENKDMIIEPLFDTQSEVIEFNLEEDEDYINHFHQQDFKKVHGYLRFDSNNELLKGKREIKVGYAPTPVDQIDSKARQNPPIGTEKFIIPLTHKHEQEGGVTEHLPIKPKTRILFYNGLQIIDSSQNYWFAEGGPTPVGYTQWPLVSMYSVWPPNGTSLKLEWSNDTRYFIPIFDVNGDPITGYQLLGETIFDQYWSQYIGSLYNKFSRRVTATFILNNVDLQEFSFDDVIFVNGKYYRPEKIIDAEIGNKTEVKVQLITLLDYRPIWTDEPLTNFSVVASNNNCQGAAGEIQITTDGTPQFTWLLGSGMTGTTVGLPVGQAPYTFTISAPVGIDSLTVTDSVGRIAQVTVEVPQSVSTTGNPSSTVVATDPTICSVDEAQCNGSIDVTPTGGAGAPYTISWQDDQNAGFNRTNLCEGSYEYIITDQDGCQSTGRSVNLDCVILNYQVQEIDAGCTTLSGPLLVVKAALVAVSVGDILQLTEISGCYQVIQMVNQKPSYTVNTNWLTDCAACQSVQFPTNSWLVERCDTVGDFQYVPNNTGVTLSPGLVIEITGAGVVDGCYEVIEESIVNPTYLVTNVFQDCVTCSAPPPEYIYFVEACDGSFGTYATSTLSNITLGSIMQFTVSGTCVSVGQLVTGFQPTDVLEDSTFYIDCNDCAGITAEQKCHNIFNATVPSSGTYVLNGNTINWSIIPGETIGICAEVGSVILLTGDAVIKTLVNSPCNFAFECTPTPQQNYAIQDCTTQLVWSAAPPLQLLNIGDVVLFEFIGQPESQCGTVISFTSTQPSIEIISTDITGCGDFQCFQ